MKADGTKDNRGGYRPGGGRPSVRPEVKRVQTTISVKPETRDGIRRLKAERRISIGRLVDDLVANTLAEEGIAESK